jgi:hypothetical protein
MKKCLFSGILCLFSLLLFAQKDTLHVKKDNAGQKSSASASVSIFDSRSHALGASGRAFLSYANTKGIFMDGSVSCENEDHGFTVSTGIVIPVGKRIKVMPGFGLSFHEEFAPMLQVRTEIDLKNVKINTRHQLGDGFNHFGEAKYYLTKWLAVGVNGQVFISKMVESRQHDFYKHSAEFGPTITLELKKISISAGNLYGRQRNTILIDNDPNSNDSHIVIPKSEIPTGSRAFLTVRYTK